MPGGGEWGAYKRLPGPDATSTRGNAGRSGVEVAADAIGSAANLCSKPVMGFMQLLKSLDDLLYEIMSWLVFYPITLWRTLRSPWAMMAYADAELEDSPGQQYTDTLSPPLFLLLTLILSHAVELTMLGQSKLVTDKTGIAGLVTDDTTLLLLRLLIFSVFPLIMAVRLVRKQKQQLTRDTLRQPFYSQCYPAAPFALLIGVGSIGTQLHWPQARLAGGLLILAALLWYGSLQTRWFSRQLGVSLLRGLWIASIGMVECVVMIVLVAPLLS
jgi:hypothetical protein